VKRTADSHWAKAQPSSSPLYAALKSRSSTGVACRGVGLKRRAAAERAVLSRSLDLAGEDMDAVGLDFRKGGFRRAIGYIDGEVDGDLGFGFDGLAVFDDRL